MAVTTVVRQPDTKHEDGASTVLESLLLPGDVAATLTFYYDDVGEVTDSRGEVYRVTLERVPEADLRV